MLVERPDAGRFTDHRDLPARLAPRVKGDVRLPWSGRTRTLAGKPTIKVSLGTGDEKLAKQRWSLVHPQVDALVQLAELRARGPDTSHEASAAPRLDPAVVRSIAGQAYHDVLAADDRGRVEPGFVTPTAGILLRPSRGPVTAGTDGARVAERAACAIERRLHQGRLRDRATHVLDEPIEESERDADVLDRVPADLRQGDRLEGERVGPLARGVPVGTVPSEVELRLNENGIELPDGHPDRRALALALTRAKVRAFDALARRECGAPVDTPERPAVASPREPMRSEPAAPLLSAMPERWIAMVRPGDKQASDTARYLRLFTGLHGDLPVDRITGVHVRAFRDALLGCPRNAPKHLERGTIAAELRRVKGNAGVMKELLGPAQTDVTSGYGRRGGSLHELGEPNDELQRIGYPGLEASHLLDLEPWRPAAGSNTRKVAACPASGSASSSV